MDIKSQEAQSMSVGDKSSIQSELVAGRNIEPTIADIRNEARHLSETLEQCRKENLALRQQLAEQPNVDVLVEALKYYSDKKHISLDGAENGVIARKALATYQAKKE